jgi:hypothetical protein
VKGKQTPKGKIPADRTSQTDSILNQPKKNPANKATRKPQCKPRQNLASIFGTLLSSQESDAHQHNTFRYRIGATIQTYSDRLHQSNPHQIVDPRGFCPAAGWPTRKTLAPI